MQDDQLADDALSNHREIMREGANPIVQEVATHMPPLLIEESDRVVIVRCHVGLSQRFVVQLFRLPYGAREKYAEPSEECFFARG